jgi:hypothetical protein
MPGISAASGEEDPESMLRIFATSGEEDPGFMPGISATSEEEDPRSMPRICNGATTKEGGGPGFYTQDLQPAEVSGEERDIFK